MLSVPTTSNTVYVSMINDGYCKEKFDPTYPTELNGIIGEGEFVEAIEKLNRTIFPETVKLAIYATFFLTLVISIIFIIKRESWIKNVGVILFIFGPIVTLVISFSIQYRQGKQMRAVVAGESKKYSTRSPIPCSWRLETTWTFIGCGNANDQAKYRVIIDIGRPPIATGGANCFNQEGQNQCAAPTYGSVASFCPKCGAARADPSLGFCLSCEQAFSKY